MGLLMIKEFSWKKNTAEIVWKCLTGSSDFSRREDFHRDKAPGLKTCPVLNPRASPAYLLRHALAQLGRKKGLERNFTQRALVMVVSGHY